MAILDYDSADEEGNDEEGAVQGEIMTAKLLGGKPYTCPALTPAKGKENVKTEEKEAYLLDISKADYLQWIKYKI